MTLPDPFRDSGGSRIVRRPAQPRSHLARFNRCSVLASQLREAQDMSTYGRHKVWDAIMPEVLDLFEELAGDSIVKIAMPRTDLFQESDGERACDDPITQSLERRTG